MCPQRDVTFSVDQSTWPPGRTPSAYLLKLDQTTRTVNMLRVLAHTALCTIPPVTYGFELSASWAWLRYWPALSANTKLELREEWTHLDSHQKTILSDDLGMGFGSVVLSKLFNLVSWPVPTTYFLREAERRSSTRISMKPTGKRGPRKSPDFIGVERLPRIQAHVLECKGTQTPGYLAEQVASGQSQKSSAVFNPPQLLGESLVIGLYIPQFGSHWPAESLIIDPPTENDPEAPTLSEQDLIEIAIRNEVATTCQLLGLPHTGNAVATHTTDHDGARFDLRHRKLFAKEVNNRQFKCRQMTHLFHAQGESQHRGMRATIGLDSTLLDKVVGQLDWIHFDPVTGVREVPWFDSGLEADASQDQITLISPSGTLIRLELLS